MANAKQKTPKEIPHLIPRLLRLPGHDQTQTDAWGILRCFEECICRVATDQEKAGNVLGACVGDGQLVNVLPGINWPR